jgi:adenosylcobinamide kinase/adenosylcobinamide-phosphate guanylyltransferase
VPVILVSNEVGLGIIPADKPTRRYASAAAKLNKAVADIAENVILMVAGQPLYVKGRK